MSQKYGEKGLLRDVQVQRIEPKSPWLEALEAKQKQQKEDYLREIQMRAPLEVSKEPIELSLVEETAPIDRVAWEKLSNVIALAARSKTAK